MSRMIRTSPRPLAAVGVLSALLLGGALSASPAASAHDRSSGTTTSSAEQTASRLTAEVRRSLADLRRTYLRYDDPAAAVAAGYLPTNDCVSKPGAGMGYHYIDPAQITKPVDPAKPSILVYVPDGEAGLRLGALEWFQPDADQDLSTTSDRPSLFGQPFDGPMLGHTPGMPVHYDLHAWLFEHNPVGVFADFNPRVSCPAS